MMAIRRAIVSLIITATIYQEQLHIGAQQRVNVTVLQPDTLQDSLNNTADRYSNITFAPVPNDRHYKSEGKTKDNVGPIATLYRLAESITETSLPGDFPYEWIDKIKNGNIDIGNDWKKIATDYLGYVIAVAIGILFFLVFPIVGMCFCCCRCCGRCGGKRIIKTASEAGYGDKCGRRTALVILSAFTSLALAGSVLMFVTNNSVSTSFNDFHNKDIDKLDDITDFFTSTVQQAETAIRGKFNFTLQVLFRDLDNIGYLLGTPIRDRVLINTGLNGTYNSIDNMEHDAKILRENLMKLDTNRNISVEKSKSFHNFTIYINKTVENMAATYPNFSTNVKNRTFVTDFDAEKFPIKYFTILLLNESLNQGISSLTAESRQNLNDIPERVQNETSNEISDLKKEVNKYTDDINKVVNDLRSMKDDVLKGINFQGFKEDGKTYTNPEYEKYRWYGGLALAGLMMLTVLLLSLGILFGLCSGDATTDPTQRSGFSNAGGNLLVAGVILTFIFGWLTMFITTVLFAAGAPAERFGCGAAQNLSVLDKLLGDYNLLGGKKGNGSWLGDMVYSGKSVNLKIAELMQSCEEGETVYTALKMEEAKVINLTDVTDYKKKFSIEDKLDSVKVSFDSINITTGPMMTFIDVMKNFDSTMNYSQYNATLSVDPVGPSKAFLESLINYNSTSQSKNQTEQDGINDLIIQFKDAFSKYGDHLNTSIGNIRSALNAIRNTTQQPSNNTLSNRCDDLEVSLKGIEQNLSTDAAQAFNSSVKDFEARLTKILDTFISNMENAVKKEIGICQPVWNMYSDIIFGVCSSTIGALGGWWCASGWTAFFLTMSICASVKLSKHFRRMKYSPEGSPKVLNGKSGSEKTHHFQNKVYHSDKPKAVDAF